MRTYVRAGAVIAGVALLSTPLAAEAETGHLNLGRDTSHPAYGDITALHVNNAKKRLVAVTRMPKVNRTRLIRTVVVMKTRNSSHTWRAIVRYNRAGKAVEKWMVMAGKPGDPAVGISCPQIRVATSKHNVRTVVPRTCLSREALKKPVKVRAAVTVRMQLRDSAETSVRDTTPFTKFLKRG